MHRLETALRLLATCTLVVASARSQHPSAIRCWGDMGATTEARDGTFVAVAAGEDCTAVIRADGRAFVNGENSAGTCEVPLVPGRRFAAISVRGLAYGLLDDGTIVGWTGGQYWHLSPGGVAPQAPPLPPGIRYTDLAVGNLAAMALRSDGVLVAWGFRAWGQLSVPPLPPGTAYSRIRGGHFHNLALLTDGTIQAWGDNALGQINVPPLPPGTTYVAMDAGVAHSVAFRSDGVVVAWGDNSYGQCNVPTPPAGTRYELACAGNAHSVAWRSDGQFVQWGSPWTPAPAVPAPRRCVQMAAGNTHTVALLDDGTVLTWGNNGFRQSFIPSPGTTPKTRRYVTTACGAAHSLAILASGELVGWGADYYGQATPPPTFAGMRFTKVGAGAGHSVALREDGVLLAWGNNSTGLCLVPPLPAGTTYVEVSACSSHTVAIRSDGVAVVFGTPQLGSGTIQPLPAGLRYERAACIYGKTMLLRSDGAIVYAGDPSSGQAVVPVAAPGLRFVKLAPCRDWNAALLSDGTPLLWGTLVGLFPGWRPVPVLPFGVYYVDIEGSYWVNTLRRSDGLLDFVGNVTDREDKIPPLDPGTSYVEIASSGLSTISARVGPTSTYISFTQGCAGSMQPARLIPRDTPAIGKTLPVNVFDLPHSLAIMLFGLQRLTPSLSLGALGMPGCDLHVSPDLTFPLVGTQNQAQWQLLIPDDKSLVGTHLFNQAIVFDAAAPNTLGAVMSNAAEGVIGHW